MESNSILSKKSSWLKRELISRVRLKLLIRLQLLSFLFEEVKKCLQQKFHYNQRLETIFWYFNDEVAF